MMNRKEHVMNLKAIALAAFVGIVAFSFVGCGSSSASNASSESASSSQSAAQSSKTVSAESQSLTVFGVPEVVNQRSGSGSVIGTCSNFYASKDDCTLKNLAKWYSEYVKTSGDNYCVIVYDEDDEYGIAASAGIVRTDVALEKDTDGTYLATETPETKYYFVKDSGELELMTDKE